jgi:hypothetical protein
MFALQPFWEKRTSSRAGVEPAALPMLFDQDTSTQQTKSTLIRGGGDRPTSVDFSLEQMCCIEPGLFCVSGCSEPRFDQKIRIAHRWRLDRFVACVARVRSSTLLHVATSLRLLRSSFALVEASRGQQVEFVLAAIAVPPRRCCKRASCVRQHRV